MALVYSARTSAQWSRLQYEDLFSDAPSRSGRVAWVVERKSVPAHGAGDIPEIVGFLVARGIVAEWELENIVVDTTSRRRGLGTLLLHELISHARGEHGKNIFLEVRQSNQSARAFYEKLEFADAGCRKNYYANPTEDAILYRLDLR
jgi:[ribosomal protein S18]-alanine N-acetyltransferase